MKRSLLSSPCLVTQRLQLNSPLCHLATILTLHSLRLGVVSG